MVNLQVVEYVSHYRQMDLDRFRSVINSIPIDVETILDVGAKDVQFKEMAEKKGFHVLALDIDPKEPSVLKADIACLPFANKSFDLVTAQEVLEHLDDVVLRKSVNEIVRVAQKYVVISVPHDEAPLGIGHRQFFSKKKLLSLFPHPVVVTYLFGKRRGYCGIRRLLGRLNRRFFLLFNKIFGDKMVELDNWMITIFKLDR